MALTIINWCKIANVLNITNVLKISHVHINHLIIHLQLWGLWISFFLLLYISISISCYKTIVFLYWVYWSQTHHLYVIFHLTIIWFFYSDLSMPVCTYVVTKLNILWCLIHKHITFIFLNIFIWAVLQQFMTFSLYVFSVYLSSWNLNHYWIDYSGQEYFPFM